MALEASRPIRKTEARAGGHYRHVGPVTAAIRHERHRAGLAESRQPGGEGKVRMGNARQLDAFAG